MKRAVAFLLSLTLVWLQMAASAQTLSRSAPAPDCTCCSGKAVCCCVAESGPDSAPVAAVPPPTLSPIQFQAVLAKVLAWTLPAPTAKVSSSSSSVSPSPSTFPLFQRDCALLI